MRDLSTIEQASVASQSVDPTVDQLTIKSIEQSSTSHSASESRRPIMFDHQTIMHSTNDSTFSFTVRPMAVNDAPDIAELARHTYEGRDFIIQEFPRWINQTIYRSINVAVEFNGLTADSINQSISPEHSPFLNKVISIECVLLLDEESDQSNHAQNGSTAWLYALRVHPAFRGMSLSTKLHSFCIDLSISRSVKRLREATDATNVISLALASRHNFQRIHSLSVSVIDEAKWHHVNQILIQKINQMNLSINQSTISDLISKGTVDDALAIQSKHATNKNFQVLTQNWISYAFSRSNLNKLLEHLNYEILVGRSLTDGSIDSFSLLAAGRDFTGPVYTFTVYAANLEQCLLHLYAICQKQALIVRPIDSMDGADNPLFHRMMGTFPKYVLEEFGDGWKMEYSFTLLEREVVS